MYNLLISYYFSILFDVLHEKFRLVFFVPYARLRTGQKSFDIVYVAKIDEYRRYNGTSCQDTELHTCAS